MGAGVSTARRNAWAISDFELTPLTGGTFRLPEPAPASNSSAIALPSSIVFNHKWIQR
jgi:hypothetical protein